MWLLGTNVVSEMVALKPSLDVLSRIGALPQAALFTPTITEVEIFYGIERLSAGRRRNDSRAAIEDTFSEDFKGRILPFDSHAARIYGRLLAERRSAGRPMSQSDVQIAAIAIGHKATLVTRNVRDFPHSGIELLNPWIA